MSMSPAYLVVLGAALGGAALAQTSGAGTSEPSTVNQPVHKASAPPACQDQPQQASGQARGGATGDSFVIKQAVSQWRAARLVGLAVYSADNEKVGAVEDVLIGEDGAAQVAVIGLGKLPGLETKDVGVPFGSIQWRPEARAPPDGTSPAANRGRPDQAVLSVTLAQLRSAPAFHYAAGSATNIESNSAAGDAAPRSPPP